MSLVSLVRTQRDTPDSLRKAISKSLDLINHSFPIGTNNVVIKPNMCYYWDYTTGQTTDPRFIGALIDLIREKISPKTEISIVESDASAMKCKYAFRMLGYWKLAQDYNVKLVNLSKDKSSIATVAAGGCKLRLKLPQTIQEADLTVNVPKIKYTMESIKITCALKNIFGCNPDPGKFRYHSKLEEAIVAINKAMRFDLCIVDGIIVSGIQPRRMGLVMASEDPVAIDAAAARIAGVNPKTIRYLQLAAKEGLGSTSFSQRGVSLDHFKAKYPRKNIQTKLLGKAYRLVVAMGLGKRLGVA